LTNANLSSATLANANLTGATVAGADLGNTNLTASQLYSTASYQSQNLQGIGLEDNNLTGWSFSGQDLTNASLNSATLKNANLTGSTVAGADLGSTSLTPSQLYSTASYQSRNVQGIGLEYDDLTGWNFSGQDMTSANFYSATLTNATLTNANLTNAIMSSATLTNANLTGATVAGANFANTNLTASQLYSTASYQAQNLQGIGLVGNDLTGWKFSGQDLTSANFYSATLTNATLTNANLTNANLYSANLTNANLTNANLTNATLQLATLTNANLTDATVVGANFGSTSLTGSQLYSTASYQAQNLQGISLAGNNLTGWNFSGQNLTNANLISGTLTNASLTGANLINANLYSATLTAATLAGANLTNANLASGTLTNANLTNANLTTANLSYANLTTATLTGATVAGANFGHTSLTDTQLYSTASYKNQTLRGIGLGWNNLTNWSFSGQDLSNANLSYATLTGADLTGAIVAGAVFDLSNLTAPQLYSTGSYRAGNLPGISLYRDGLTGWNLSDQNLTSANLSYANLTNATLTGAIVAGAVFDSSNLTAPQLYSTGSYRTGNLHGISLHGNDLTGWDFSGQNLTNANLFSATMTNATLTNANLTNAILNSATLINANLTGSDLRGAQGFVPSPATTITTNTILPDGTIQGLNLNANTATWFVRNYSGNIPIQVLQGMSMNAGTSLVFQFDGAPWSSTISFDAGIPVTLGGNLELGVANGVDPTTLFGHSFQMFNWSGVTPSGQFNVVNDFPASCLLDASQVYSTGNLTVLGHATPSLSVVRGNNQTVIVGAAGISDGLSLSNGTSGQSGLVSLDVNSLGSGVSGLTGGALVGSGSAQPYAAALSTGTLGTQVETFSLNVGDDHTLPGASAPVNLSTSATLTVLGHAAPSLSVVSGNNQTVIVGAAGISADLNLSNGTAGQTGIASLDVNSLGSGVGGPAGGKLVASGSSQTYIAALGANTLGRQVETFSMNVGDEHTLPGASAPMNLSTSATLTVLGHAAPSLRVVSGNDQRAIFGVTGISAGLSLSNGTSGQSGLASLDVNSLGGGVIGPTGGALVASGSAQFFAANLSTGTLGTQTQTFSLNVGDDQTLAGASAAADISTSATLSVVTNRIVTASTASFGLVHLGAAVSQPITLSTDGNDNSFTRVNVRNAGPDANGISVTGGTNPVFNGSSVTDRRTLGGIFGALGAITGSISLPTTGEGLVGEAPINVPVNYTAQVYSGQAEWNDANGVWGTSANWKDTVDGGPSGAPGILGYPTDTATFGTVVSSGTTVVVLSGAAPVLSNLTFSNSNASYSILLGTGTTGLTLTGTDGSSPAAVTVISGTHWVDTPILLGSSVVVSDSGSLRLNGNLSDGGLTRSLTLDGGGKLILSGSNSYSGGTVVSSGALVVTDNYSLPERGSLTIGAGGVLIFDPAATAVPLTSSQVALAVNPVPEPGTLILFSVGTIGLLGCAWRRRRLLRV